MPMQATSAIAGFTPNFLCSRELNGQRCGQRTRFSYEAVQPRRGVLACTRNAAETKCDEIRREGDPPHSQLRVCLTLSQKALDSSRESTYNVSTTKQNKCIAVNLTVFIIVHQRELVNEFVHGNAPFVSLYKMGIFICVLFTTTSNHCAMSAE